MFYVSIFQLFWTFVSYNYTFVAKKSHHKIIMFEPNLLLLGNRKYPGIYMCYIICYIICSICRYCICIHYMCYICKGLFINDVINFGGYRNPPLPLVIIRHFLATPPPCACNSRQYCLCDKTPYVGFLTIVEGPLQSGTTLSVNILSFGA